MKKYLFVLAAVVFLATACNKADIIDYSNVQVKLSVTMPGTLTKSNFSLTNSTNPVGGMTVTWQEGDLLTLIVFQGDNASWQANYVKAELSLPAAAEGLTTYDVSSLGTSLDLSSFDPSKNLKYVVVLGPSFNDSSKSFIIWNGGLYVEPTAPMSDQINYFKMIAETDVQEVPFPSGDLVLSGKLHWITSVLAIQFEIDSAADIDYPADSYLMLDMKNSQFVDCYEPITKLSGYYASKSIRNIYFPSTAKLSDALDANKCRYFTIPADDMTVTPEQKLGGTQISFRKYYGSNTDYVSDITIDSGVTIEAGKVYGIRIHVTDTNGDGNPEFTKM